YGSWLPGDERGYVGFGPDESGRIVNHNRPHTPPAPPNPALKRAARRRLKSPPVRLNRDQAAALREQFLETTTHRGWVLLAAAIMTTHLHLLVGASGDPEPNKIRDDLKSYGTRCLNRLCG